MPELRKDPITGRWVIISIERSRRPSDFVREPVVIQGGRICPFCPGHELKTPPEVLSFRDYGAANSPGWRVRVVPNKFPALRVEGDVDREAEGLYDKMTGVGAHEVVIESTEHESTLAEMPEKAVEEVFWAYRERVLDLRKDRRLRYILIFKNHGEQAGASLEHTHSQIIALPVVPRRVQEEIEGSRRHFDYRGRCVYCDIVRQEIKDGRRVVLETDHFLVIEPFAPRFAFESWILPRKHESHFENTESAAMRNLAWVVRTTLRKLDRVLERPAYNMVIHTSPVQDGPVEHYHWHIEIYPRISRIAGFEWGTGFYINPAPPEETAEYLREAGLP